jgi:hypothetical protein
MRIFILSINHGHQLAPLRDALAIPEVAERTGLFRNLVKEIIAARGIELICEESDPGHLSIAQHEAFLHTPRIQWKNIMMTAQERFEAGIWEALLYRPQEVDYDRLVTTDLRIPEDHIREEFFRDEIVRTAEGISAKSVFVLCGDAHTESLGAKLTALGHQVEIDQHLTPVKNWK